jgi:DNA-binding NtrC family response regulator
VIKGGQGQSILLVEDDPALLKLGEELLNELGYKVFATESPTTAIAFATKGEDKIDLLLTDVIMPEMNGKELAETLKRLLPELKVLFTSGYTSNVIAHHSVLDEGINFLQKPLSIQDLADKLSKILS